MMPIGLRFHPSEMMLHRYAEGILRRTPSLWVKRHLAACHECRHAVSFTRSLYDALATIPTSTFVINGMNRMTNILRTLAV